MRSLVPETRWGLYALLQLSAAVPHHSATLGGGLLAPRRAALSWVVSCLGSWLQEGGAWEPM
jgi:hypothetical protein